MMCQSVVISGLKSIPTHISLQNRSQFRKAGFAAIHGLIKEGLSSTLEEDAIASAQQSMEFSVNQSTIRLGKYTTEETVYRSTRRLQSINVLPQLQSALLPFLRVLTGHQLIPLNSWYIYYEGTDGISLHVDPEKSDISVLISVLGKVGPLHFHPELEGQNQNQLDAYYQGADWMPNSGIPFAYPYDGILVNRGHSIPHHRTGRPISQRCAVATMHYTIL